MKSPHSSLASRYSIAFVLGLICLMILMASAITVSRTSPLATASFASSGRAKASSADAPIARLMDFTPPAFSASAYYHRY